MKINRRTDDIPWVPHPVVTGVSIKPLISFKEHNLNVTCMLVNVPVGKEVPEHIHEAAGRHSLSLAGEGCHVG